MAEVWLQLSSLFSSPTHLPLSLEEVSETLNGHALKLRCLEGLWRQTGANDIEKNVKGGASAGDGVSSTSGSSTPDR